MDTVLKAPARREAPPVPVLEVLPTSVRVPAEPELTGRGVTIAFLDSGFTRHPDLTEPVDRIAAFHDVTDPAATLDVTGEPEGWRWHGTQTSVAAAGNGHLSGGRYRGLASESKVVLVKVGDDGKITEPNIEKGLAWVLANHERLGIRVVSLSLGGDVDVPFAESRVNQLAEEAVAKGLVVVVAAGNSGCSSRPRPVPPATAPSVITVGGYNDKNRLDGEKELYCGSFGVSADGIVKPEVIAPASWVAAPILVGSPSYREADALSRLAAAPEAWLRQLTWKLREDAGLPESVASGTLQEIRAEVSRRLTEKKIVGTRYQHVDGTSFAAPIVASVAAQLLEAVPSLCPKAVKQILIATADRIQGAPAIRQGYGVLNAKRALAEARRDPHLHRCAVGTPPRIQGSHLVFTYHDDAARKVELYGDFRGHMETVAELKKGSDDLWSARVASPTPGRYRYKFVVDGARWVEDPAHGLKVDDGFGGFNSILNVGWDVR